MQGAISELELDDALLRMELDREWTRERDRVEVEEYVHQEEIEAEQLEDVVRYMRERPLEMQAERYRKGLVLMQKREKEEKRRAIEQARLDRIAAEEERRRKVKAREERHEQKELSRTRKCGKCGQVSPPCAGTGCGAAPAERAAGGCRSTQTRRTAGGSACTRENGRIGGRMRTERRWSGSSTGLAASQSSTRGLQEGTRSAPAQIRTRRARQTSRAAWQGSARRWPSAPQRTSRDGACALEV